EKLVFEESRSGNVDIISLGGVIVAQKGSSGGAVVAESGKLVAIIVTSTEAPQTSERDLRAITLSHINRNLIADKNVSLSSFLGGNLSQKAEEFRSGEFTRLAALITDALVD
ncbi:MAG: hypothetical protein Q7S15_00330, partial [bacterium]|nr:hypothetical protein [bacterium]